MVYFTQTPGHLYSSDSLHQQRNSPDSPGRNFNSNYKEHPHDESHDFPPPQSLGGNDRLPSRQFDVRDHGGFPPHLQPDHREFHGHPFNEGAHDEFPRGSPRPEFYDRRGPPHPDFNDRDIPPPHEFRRPHHYRPPLLPLPPPRPDFNDRGHPPEMREIGGVPATLPPLRMPKVKTVPAEKIFELPGRNERPSHVRRERERENVR